MAPAAPVAGLGGRVMVVEDNLINQRVVVALLTPDRLHLQGKMGLGSGGEALCARFTFPMDGDPDDVVDDAIDSGKACWVNPARVERGGAEGRSLLSRLVYGKCRSRLWTGGISAARLDITRACTTHVSPGRSAP